jgi:transposase InsO family protein
MSKKSYRSVPLPAAWPKHVHSAVLHAISLAAAALTATRGWAADHSSSRVRLRAKIERLEQEMEQLREELRLKDARLSRVPAHERPHYPPVERLAILQLRAARGWSVRQTAERFHLSPVTLSNWMRRLEERGPDALVQSPVPLNKYPDYVAHVVQQLKVLCPSFGYGKIAHVFGREGLRLGTSTVQRMIRRVVASEPEPEPDRARRANPMKKVIARHPHHAWHCDLTTVPTSMGFWTPALPFGLAQRWPFCWWMVVLADQFSARILRLAVFRNQPTTEEVQTIVARAVDEASVPPRYLITDKGFQFRDGGFRGWCRQRGIRHVFGALGQFGSIPFIERLILTIKRECTTRFLFPFSYAAARKELALFTGWYNRVRPHERLRGATPDEIHGIAEPFRERARFEPRVRWPRAAKCTSPQSTSGECSGARLALHVRYLEGRKHLPVVALERTA